MVLFGSNDDDDDERLEKVTSDRSSSTFRSQSTSPEFDAADPPRKRRRTSDSPALLGIGVLLEFLCPNRPDISAEGRRFGSVSEPTSKEGDPGRDMDGQVRAPFMRAGPSPGMRLQSEGEDNTNRLQSIDNFKPAGHPSGISGSSSVETNSTSNIISNANRKRLRAGVRNSSSPEPLPWSHAAALRIKTEEAEGLNREPNAPGMAKYMTSPKHGANNRHGWKSEAHPTLTPRSPDLELPPLLPRGGISPRKCSGDSEYSLPSVKHLFEEASFQSRNPSRQSTGLTVYSNASTVISPLYPVFTSGPHLGSPIRLLRSPSSTFASDVQSPTATMSGTAASTSQMPPIVPGSHNTNHRRQPPQPPGAHLTLPPLISSTSSGSIASHHSESTSASLEACTPISLQTLADDTPTNDTPTTTNSPIQESQPGYPDYSPSTLGAYKCKDPDCTATFQTQYLLNSHQNVHSSSRPHHCPVPGCTRALGGKGFKRKNEMIRHGLVHDSPGYICPYCADRTHTYPRPDNLQRHVHLHHKDKDKADPALRDVLSQRPVGMGANPGRRRRV